MVLFNKLTSRVTKLELVVQKWLSRTVVMGRKVPIPITGAFGTEGLQAAKSEHQDEWMT